MVVSINSVYQQCILQVTNTDKEEMITMQSDNSTIESISANNADTARGRASSCEVNAPTIQKVHF